MVTPDRCHMVSSLWIAKQNAPLEQHAHHTLEAGRPSIQSRYFLVQKSIRGEVASKSRYALVEVLPSGMDLSRRWQRFGEGLRGTFVGDPHCTPSLCHGIRVK